MTITRAQIDSRIVTEEGFAQWFVDKLMPDELPEFHAEFSRDKLLGCARRARRTAVHLGFKDPPSQVHFVGLMWKIGAGFFLFPGFREIAKDTRTPGPVRIQRFYTQVTPDQAADAILGANDTLLFAGPFDNESQA